MGMRSMFMEDFIKSYDEEGDVGYLLVVDIEYPKILRMLHCDLPFLPDRMKVNKVKKLVCNVTFQFCKKTFHFNVT